MFSCDWFENSIHRQQKTGDTIDGGDTIDSDIIDGGEYFQYSSENL